MRQDIALGDERISAHSLSNPPQAVPSPGDNADPVKAPSPQRVASKRKGRAVKRALGAISYSINSE